ncbi:copper amine oxidase N-terminal domain-containing protein [bacterium]|nr:MAG: copper amine oxidase N-terminal domain-containing protein [bacterium]
MTTLLLSALLLQGPQIKTPPNVKPADKRYRWGNANRAGVNVNGKSLSEGAMIRDNRVLVPMRPIFEALGVPVQWFPENRKVVATQGSKIVSLVIGENFAYNPNPIPLDYPPRIVNGRVMVPLRFVSETLGAKVSWDGDAKVASVTMPDPDTAGAE